VLRLLSKKSFWLGILPGVLLNIFIYTSCDFIDLRQIGLTIEPNTANSILPEPDSPVVIRFDTEVIKNEAEGVFQINSDYGSVKGDKIWHGNDLYFIPVQGWTAGIRYTLNLTGTIRSTDGRELRIEHYVPFYAINRESPPILRWHSPTDGESVGTNNIVYEFHFSAAMDRLSVESALTTEGIGSKTFEWSDDNLVLRIIPQNALSPWVSYRWNIKDSAKSAGGIPLPKTYSGYFLTDLDQTLPAVANVYPVLFADGSWFPTAVNMENGLNQSFGHPQGIAVSFNKPVSDNALRSLRFEPYLTGRTEFLSNDCVIFILTRDPEPETIYTLILSGETRDTEGLKLGSDYRISFASDIPYLDILSLTANNTSEHQVQVDPAAGEVNISIRFSLPFNNEEKLLMPQRITLTPFFPKTLAPVALQYISWISDDRLFLRWEGLTPGGAGGYFNDSHFYKLVIPGGKGGISSGQGVYMKEDFVLYLEAVR